MVADKNSVTKEQHERHKKILDALLKLPENRCCADCGSRGPRWASVNLGVFLCIQCSGIHRSLGVHISQVRSATLDTWLPDQVAFIQTMGNQKANEYWEADLPSNFKRPSEQDRPGVESFIRAKYERKAFVARERRRSKEDRPASRHEGGYSSDNGPASRLAHDERRGGGSSSQSPAKPTIAVKIPVPRIVVQPTPVAAPHVAASTAPPHKVESAPALIDLLSLNDTTPVTPVKPPTSSTEAVPASTAGTPGGWAAFPEAGARGTAGKAAPTSGVATSAATSAPPTAAPAGTMSALTDLFTASTPGGASQPAPAAPVAATPEKPKNNATDIMSLFDQGSPLMNPQQAQMQQQMLYMQQQQLGGMPGGFPGGMPGVLPGAVPGVNPGAMPGHHPGAMPGVHPGAMPGMFPQPVAQAIPEASSSHVPVTGPFVAQMMPGYAPYGQGMPPAGFPGFYPGAPQPGFQGPYGTPQASGPLGGLGGPEQFQPQAPVAAPVGPGHKDAPGAQYDFSDLQAFAK